MISRDYVSTFELGPFSSMLPHSIVVPGHAYCTVEVVNSINEVALSNTTSQSNSSIS
jgi:hypothetical protein